jgi:hypothetical protein
VLNRCRDAIFGRQRASFLPKRRNFFLCLREKIRQYQWLVVFFCLVTYCLVTAIFWLLFWQITLKAPLGQPRVYLDPALKYNATLISTAEQLSGLQDQLSVRIDQHNVVMSKNLDNFTATLNAITADTDVAIDYIQLVEKYVFPGRITEESTKDVEAFMEEVQKLHNMAVSYDTRTKLQGVQQIAIAMATEMTDMELFMQEISSASNTLLNNLGKIVKDQAEKNGTGHLAARSKPQYPIYGGPAPDLNPPEDELRPGQTLQWVWDEIQKQGSFRRHTGAFIPVQQAIIESMLLPSLPHPFHSKHALLFSLFFPSLKHRKITPPDFLHSMNSSGNITDIPSRIRYGIGLPDTHQTDLRTNGYAQPFISHGLSVPNPDCSPSDQNYNYTCDIIAHFAQPNKNAIVQVKVGPGLVKEVVMRQLVGLQSMECGAEGEEKKDVVRYEKKEKGEGEPKEVEKVALRVG